MPSTTDDGVNVHSLGQGEERSTFRARAHAFAQKAAHRMLTPIGLQLRIHPDRRPRPFPEATDEELELCSKFKPYTRTSRERQWTLLRALEYVERRGMPGDIVECGVWQGGNMMMAKAFLKNSAIKRRFWLFDTFEGMAAPTDHDKASDGRDAASLYQARRKENRTEWCFAPLSDVTENFRRHALLDDAVVFRKGMVEDTLKASDLPEEIAILRLDTDFYESTKVELDVLYPRLKAGGVLIIDDYGNWLGARKAVDEYFAESGPLFLPVDSSLRMAVKP